MLTLINRDSLMPFSGFSDLLEDWLSEAPRGWAAPAGSAVPATDVEETESHYLVSMDVPGVSKDQIQIEVHDGTLRVTAERKDRFERKGSSSRQYGKWQRSFTLPQGMDAEHIEASCEDGVLRIALPKSEAAKPRQIKIQDGRTGLFQRLLSAAKKEEPAKADIPVRPEKSA